MILEEKRRKEKIKIYLASEKLDIILMHCERKEFSN